MASITDQDVLTKLAQSSDSFQIDAKKFKLPEIDDFYANNLTTDKLKEIEKTLQTNTSHDETTFYTEQPYSETPGFYANDNVIIVKALPIFPGMGGNDLKMRGERANNLNEYDGDTMYFDTNSIQDGAQEFYIGGAKFTGIKDYITKNIPLNELSQNKFGLRFLGINCPEIPHYSVVPAKGTKTIKKTYAEIKKEKSKYLVNNAIPKVDSSEIEFLCNEEGTFSEIVNKDYSDDLIEKKKKESVAYGYISQEEADTTKYYMIVYKDDSKNFEDARAGIRAKDALAELISKGNDYLLMLDFKTLNRNGADYPEKYNDDFFSDIGNMLIHPFGTITRLWYDMFGPTGYRYLGFNMYGQDAYKRFLGALYVKVAGAWVNAAKYVLQKVNEVEALPDYTSNPESKMNKAFCADAFNLWSYNPQGQKIIDSLKEISKADFDNRRAIQKQITGIDFEAMKDWTVMVGDCMLLVPPTSIRTVTQLTNEKVPLLRSRGSMVKGATKSEKYIEMTLYFNEDEGINGIPYKTRLNDAQHTEVTYYMNGLRSLIAMFKLTPFLPIENHYINSVLNIEAVSLVNLQVSTTPGYPKLMSAVLTLQEFNYHVYVNIPFPDMQKKDSFEENLFAKTIHYDTMRWYYQRPIIAGQKLRDRNYAFDSTQYLKETFGSKTVLQPMKFDSSLIDFYTVDTDYLDQQLQLKIEALNKPIKTQNTISESAKAWSKQLAFVYSKVSSLKENTDLKNALKALNSGKLANYDRSESRYSNIFRDNPNNRINKTSLVKISDSDVSVSQHDVIENFLDPIYDTINTYLSGYATSVWMDQDSDKRDGTYTVRLMVNIGVDRTMISSAADMQNFLKVVTGAIGCTTDSFYDADNDRVKLYLSGKFKYDENKFFDLCESGFSFDTSAPGYKFLQYCATKYGTDQNTSSLVDSSEWSGMTSDTMMNILTDRKESIDVETMNSLKFTKYPIKNVMIKNISCVYGNAMSRMGLKLLDGYAPQYCGGQDTIIEVNIQTRDEDSARLINLLPRMAAEYVRNYRLVLPCWPLRIDSEITRLFGVNEVLVDSVEMNTVPNQPGLFDITMRLTSVDRTMRNKESLKRIEVDNAGSKTTNNASTIITKSYFDMKDVLAKTEIYPDLELPTLNELAYYGFRFIRYANTGSSRVYPDPDFYFVYAQILTSEILKASILSNIDGNIKSQTRYTISDNYGAQFELIPEKNYGLKIDKDSSNAQAQEFLKQREIIEKAIDSASTYYKKISESESSGITNNNMVDAFNSFDIFNTWNISDKVKCIFREKKYEKVMKNDDQYYSDYIKKKSEELIAIIDKELDNPIDRIAQNKWEKWNSSNYIKTVNDKKKLGEVLSNQPKKLLDAITSVYEDVVTKKMKGILDAFDLDKVAVSNGQRDHALVSFGDFFIGMMLAAADAASGEAEFNDKKDLENWQARLYTNAESIIVGQKDDYYKTHGLVPYCTVEVSGQGKSGKMLAKDLDEAISNGVAFGPFQIKMFPKEQLRTLIDFKDSNDVPSKLFIDPYYMRRQIQFGDNDEQVRNYKMTVAMDPYITAHAYLRNMLFWFKQMLKDGVLLSLYEIIQGEAIKVFDKNTYQAFADKMNQVHNHSSFSVQQAMQAKKKATKADTEKLTDEEKKTYKTAQERAEALLKKQKEADDAMAAKINDILKENKIPLALGKFFAAMLMATTSGSQTIYGLMKDRNYDMLNQLTRGAQLPNSGSEYLILRKFILALVGRNVITSMEKIGSDTKTVSEMMGTLINEKVYIDRAEDPSIYIRDSFYDMIINDKRGRMARAFPSFYMMFIDEGRDIGLWKLHDNFYNMSAISEIEIVKSRKIAADTAHITMTNMFKTYTTDDEDSREIPLDAELLKNYQYTWRDLFNSVFSPRTYYMQEELRRLEAMPVERAELKPGVRLHIRLGYSADASELPIVFNGTVAEVGAGEAVEIVCQGDGVELTNPILSATDAEDIQHQDSFIIPRMFKNWLTKGASPRTILGSILTTKGGFVQKELYKITSGRFFNQNPYGITHFGDPMFTDIFKGSECVQNLYEASNKPSWSDDSADMSYLAKEYKTENTPKLSAHVFGKSYWDMMAICAGASPDFICSVAPFGLRSTVFYGLPRYYYAYEYAKQMSDNGEYSIIEKRKPFQQYHVYTSFSDIVGNNISASSKEVRTCAVGMYESQGAFNKQHMSRVGPMWVDFDIYPEKQKTMTVDTQFVAKGIPLIGDIVPFLNQTVNELGVDKLYTLNSYETAWRITATALKNSVKDMYQGELIVIGDPTVKPYDKMWIEDSYEGIQGCCEVEAVVHSFNVQDGFTSSLFADCIATIDDRHEQVIRNVAGNAVMQGVATYTTQAALTALFVGRSRPLMTSMLNYVTKGEVVATDALKSLMSVLGQEEVLKSEKLLKNTESFRNFLGLNSPSFKYAQYSSRLGKFGINEFKPENINTLSDLASELNNMSKSLNSIDMTELIDSVGQSNSKDAAKAVKDLTEQSEAIKEATKSFNVDNCLDDLKKITNAAAGSESDDVIKAVEKINSVIDKKGVFSSADDIADFAKALNKLDGIEGINDILKASKIAENVSVKAAATAGKFVTSAKDEVSLIKKIATVLKNPEITKATKATLLSGKAAFAGLILSSAIEMAVWSVATAFAYEYVERWMKNLQVLQVYPLKKHGRVMTAGLDGSRGLVVGSPTENMEGTVQTWLGNLLNEKSGGGAGDIAYNFVLNLLASQDMMDIAAKFRRRNNVPDPGTTIGIEQISQNILSTIASDELKRQSEGYRSLLLVGRVTDVASAEGIKSYNNFSIGSTKDIEINPNVKEGMAPLDSSKTFIEAIKSKYVKILHNETQGTKALTFTIEDANKTVNAIVSEDKNGNTIYDMPFVRPDLFYLLVEIYDRLKTEFLINGTYHDNQTKFLDHPLIIESALRAGENTWNSTGFVCRISVPGYDLEALLKTIYQEQMKINHPYFMYNKLDSGSFDILVFPPKSYDSLKPTVTGNKGAR